MRALGGCGLEMVNGSEDLKRLWAGALSLAVGSWRYGLES